MKLGSCEFAHDVVRLTDSLWMIRSLLMIEEIRPGFLDGHSQETA
jgi:hypothetical protein